MKNIYYKVNSKSVKYVGKRGKASDNPQTILPITLYIQLKIYLTLMDISNIFSTVNFIPLGCGLEKVFV